MSQPSSDRLVELVLMLVLQQDSEQEQPISLRCPPCQPNAPNHTGEQQRNRYPPKKFTQSLWVSVSACPNSNENTCVQPEMCDSTDNA